MVLPDGEACDDSSYEHACKVVRSALHCTPPQGDDCSELDETSGDPYMEVYHVHLPVYCAYDLACRLS